MAADQTALNAGNGEKVSREQILRAIASLLSSKDTAYIDAVKKRAADGNLKIKGGTQQRHRKRHGRIYKQEVDSC